MRIYPINNTPNFKRQEYIDDGILGYDDKSSMQNRSEIREWRDSYYTPYRSIYQKECNLSEYEMNKLLSSLTKKNKFIDSTKIKGINAYNVTSVNNDGTSYRGSTLKNKPESLKILKDAGIERIIDLVGYKEYKQNVEQAGLEYYHPEFGTSHLGVWSEYAFEDKRLYDNEKLRKDSIKKFVEFIQTVQKGYFYIGCEYGTYKTENFILLNNAFNPKANTNYIPCRDLYQIEKLRLLYENLTPEDKDQMNWSKEFDENLKNKLKEIERKFLNDIF